MQQLVGRLDVLDPGASHSLKVIAYFDALVEGHASAEMLVRGASFLSGVTAGVASTRGRLSVGPRGQRVEPRAIDSGWPTHGVPGGGIVWIERDGGKNANDDMILERLAIGIGIALERATPHVLARAAIETVIDPAETPESRREAAVRLTLDSLGSYVVIAVPASTPAPTGHHTIVVTGVGAVRAVVRRADEPINESRAGVGLPGEAGQLDRSWVSALTALRLTDSSEPVIRAHDLGALLVLACTDDASTTEVPDLAVLGSLLRGSPRMLLMLRTLAAAESLRAASVALGIHHSTLQSRALEFSAAFGFDVRSTSGRSRLGLALALYRFRTTRFD